jgi:hypothetical protein
MLQSGSLQIKVLVKIQHITNILLKLGTKKIHIKYFSPIEESV